MASRGMRILVLDQTHPLHFQAVPADLTPTDYVGRIAFPENAEHPAFRGLGTEDFFCWSGDHIVYRNAYKKASYGGSRSLLRCDDELSCTALVENAPSCAMASSSSRRRRSARSSGTIRSPIGYSRT